MSVREELEDVQGIIVGGYGALQGARFVLLAINDAAAAGRWLAALDVRSADGIPTASDTCLNVALTPAGLTKLGLPQATMTQFPVEYTQGMAGTAHRQRILGDVGSSAPENWQWGAPDGAPIDLLLMLYAQDEARVEQLTQDLAAGFGEAGLAVVHQLDSSALNANKEHFGFRDGISQPVFNSMQKVDTPQFNVIADGEFVLGHANAYGQLTNRPVVPSDERSADLPDMASAEDASTDAPTKDFGRNGSYLVFRQMSQDVPGFWRYVHAQANAQPNAPADDQSASQEHSIRLAAKMVGRWPSGAPLTTHPNRDDTDAATENDFLYVGSGDEHGLGCPIGSHIRRTNPRDSLDPKPGSELSIEVGKRHRILRRGRAYGPPVVASCEAADILAAGIQNDSADTKDTGDTAAEPVPRGLHFVCFNTHLGRQFEFVQHTWVNNPKFDGLYADDDPLIGDRGGAYSKAATFTIQAEPVRSKVHNMPRFVQVLGGGYFFMPGIRALRYLARLAVN